MGRLGTAPVIAHVTGGHLLRIAGFATASLLLIVWPFLPGPQDPIAVPLSTALQVAGVAGVPLLPLALIWLVSELRGVTRVRFTLATASLVLGTLLALLASLLVLGVISAALGAAALAAVVLALRRLVPALRRLRGTPSIGTHPAPLYLAFLPTTLVAAPLMIAEPITAASRARAIEGTVELIAAIEGHRATHGGYPASLLALHPDYLPPTVGVARYEYAPGGDAYNLAFEQPRFLLDNVGAREYVVYNPRDEHVIPSHAAWILQWSPAVLATRQGWYASHDAGSPHWKYFWFD